MSDPSVIIPIQIASKEFLIFLDHLHFSLPAVLKQTIACEKVLLDYCSNKNFIPHIKKFARLYSFEYKRADNLKDSIWARGRALNAGVAKSKGDPIFFIDTDCVIPKNYLEKHCESISEKTFTFSPFYDSTEKIVKSSNYSELIKQRKAIIGLRPNSHSHIGVQRSWLEKNNGFDEAYRGWGAEDDDLILRLKRSGIKPVMIKTYPIHLWHPTWQVLMNSAGKRDIQKSTLVQNRRRYWTKRGGNPKKKKRKK